MNCCDEPDIEHDSVPRLAGLFTDGLRIERDAHCLGCGATMTLAVTVGRYELLDILSDGLVWDEADAEDIEKAECPTCGGVGGGSIRCPSCGGRE